MAELVKLCMPDGVKIITTSNGDIVVDAHISVTLRRDFSSYSRARKREFIKQILLFSFTRFSLKIRDAIEQAAFLDNLKKV